MNLMLFSLFSLALVFGTGNSIAADFKKSSHKACDYEVTGKIEKGDDQKLQSLIDAGVVIEKLCMNSPGGAYATAIKLTDLFMDYGIATYIRKNDSCLSACAVAFLGGSVWGDRRGVSRELEPGGKLGFHAPYIKFPNRSYPADVLENVYKLALKIASDIVERKSELKVGDDFLRRFLLQYNPNGMNRVNTIGDAIVTNIQIVSDKSSDSFTEKNYINLCYNLFQLHKVSFIDPRSAKKPFHQLKSDELAKVVFVRNMKNGAIGHYTVFTKHDPEIYIPSSACAISPDLGSVYLWTNEFIDEIDFVNADRKLQLNASAWMAYDPAYLIEKLQ